MEASLVRKYEEALAKDPSSRVFAQLGELYRKMGMIDKALMLYRDGIKRHPSYNLGYLGLAFCYVDLEQYQLAYATLRPLVESSRDNLRLQKLFAHCCEQLHYKDEALETWKYLLFINPKDSESISKVTALEASESENIQASTSQKSFQIDHIHASPSDDVDDWIRVDLASREDLHEPVFAEKFSHEDTEQLIQKESNEEEAPLMSLTLVDLYIAQGHQAKAQEVLQKMIELNPSDERLTQRIESLNATEETAEISVEDAHSRLLQIVEQKQVAISEEDSNDEIDVAVSQRLGSFLQNIKRRAEEKTSRS